MLVTLPCVLVLLDFWPLRRWQTETICPPQKGNSSRFPSESNAWLILERLWLVIEKLPLFALSAAVCVVIVYGQQGAGAMSMSHRVPFDLRVANAATSYVMYLWKTLWPVNLAIFYPHPAIVKAGSTSSMIWNAAMAAMLLAAITLVALWSARRRPYLAVGWLWYLGTLVPVIGLIQIGVQAMADRYTYLPMIGVYVAVVWGAAELAARYDRLRAPLSAAAAVLLAAWTVMAAHQTATWKNSFTVFQHAIDVTPDNFFAHNHLGLAYHNIGKMEEAGAEYAKAVQIARLRFGQWKFGGLLRRPR